MGSVFQEDVCAWKFPASLKDSFALEINSALAVTTVLLGLLLLGIILWLFLQRRHTQWRLQSRGLPTIMWRPKFVRYRPFEDKDLLSSTTITRMLPRMERMKGPFGMYGTVYGINTAVVHVAHPLPVKAIFGTSTTTTTKTSNNNTSAKSSTDTVVKGKSNRKRSSVALSTGASKAPAYNHFKNFCGEGVFTADGDDWKAKRTSVMHCLIRGTGSAQSEIAQRLEKEANLAADTFEEQVRRLQDQHDTNNTIVTNVVPLLQRSTVSLIYRFITHHTPAWAIKTSEEEAAFAENTSLYSSDDSSTTTTTTTTSLPSTAARDSKVTAQGDSSSALLDRYLKSIIRIRMIILAQSRSIWFVLPRWCYSTFSSLFQDEIETVFPIRDFAEQACQEARPGSPLARLKTMDSHNRPTSSLSSSGNITKDLLDEAITLLFAGQDTSAATLSWTIHLLSLHSEIQDQIAEEVKAAVSENGSTVSSPRITRDMIAKLPFMDAVIKESMRLYPVAPFVVRKLQHDVFVEAEDADETNRATNLPAGAIACIWIYSLHRNRKFWNRPDDFLPNRWLSDEKDLGQSNGAYMPFAAGPRNCVGQPIAHIVLRTLLARLVLKYKFVDPRVESAKRPEDLRIEMQAGFTVLPTGGVPVEVRPRL